MMFARLTVTFSLILGCLLVTPVDAADTCQDLVKLKELPQDYKVVSRSALGPAELQIRSNGTCTCNDLPAVQRSLGQAEPAAVNWACDTAEAADTKDK